MSFLSPGREVSTPRRSFRFTVLGHLPDRDSFLLSLYTGEPLGDESWRKYGPERLLVVYTRRGTELE